MTEPSRKKVSSYSELLKDPRWQRRRLEILQRSNFTCENCSAGHKTLHVHHKLYRKGAKPWEYADNELEALCEDCHDTKHKLRAEINEVLGSLDTEQLAEAAGFLQAISVGYAADAQVMVVDAPHACGIGYFYGIGGTRVLDMMEMRDGTGFLLVDAVVKELKL